ncbi:hypothetical protein TKK_0016059 [Trichogramma kaykai]
MQWILRNEGYIFSRFHCRRNVNLQLITTDHGREKIIEMAKKKPNSEVYKRLMVVGEKVLIGIFVQSTLRSKNTILILNRLGVCICYEEIVRIRARLAAYTVQENSINVPIPSHFDSTSYVTTAFDNFDRNEATISGLDSTHDTVIVLFQDLNNNQPNKKPNVSTCTIEKDRRAFSSILKCQEIIDYYPANKEFSPPSYWKSSLSDFIINIDSSFIDLNTNHFLWYLSRFSSSKEDDDLYEQSSYQEDDELHEQSTYQLTPSWTPFNSMVSKDEHCKQKMGFLPICPSSPTNHSTLFTCMKNFDNVRIQFHQDHLVVFCDECIYSSVRQIQSQNATEFDKIILCLGGFHMIKVAFTCIELTFELIRADRTGDWLLHLETVKKLQPVFHVMDRLKYIKCSAIYLADMLSLEKRSPKVFEQFL